MKLGAIIALLVGMLTVIGTVSICGCGSGNRAEHTTPTLTGGRAVCTVLWPHASRLVPIASKSVRVEFLQSGAVVAERLLIRPEGGKKVSIAVENLPVDTLMVRATAYPQADGIGTALATGSVSIVIRANETVPFTLTMASTIVRLEITPDAPALSVGDEIQLTMTARDAEDNVVLITPTKIKWEAVGTSVSVNSSGLITALSGGTSTITVTEQEAVKSASLVITVSSSPDKQISAPVALTGFNLDVIFELQGTTTATTFDDTTTAWIENGVQNYAGFPAGSFASRLPNVVTKGSTIYQLQPFTANNVLALTEASQQGKLTLTIPTRYRALSIAATSSNARFFPGNGRLVLNFEDNSNSLPITYNARDWWGEGRNNDPNRIFESGLYRAENAGMNVPINDLRIDTTYRNFNLYETTIDLSNIEGVDYTHRRLRSITFQRADGARLTGIFAVSGIALAP